MKKYKWREQKKKISLVIFFSKKITCEIIEFKKEKEKKKEQLTSRKRNKYQTNRNCHMARDKQIHMVEAWYQEHGWDKNISLSQIHIWETFNVR